MGKGDGRRVEDTAKIDQGWPRIEWNQPRWVPPAPKPPKGCGCRPGTVCEDCEGLDQF